MSNYFGREFPPISVPTQSISKGVQSLGVAVIGPPGSGKTRSILRMLEGAKRVYPGRPAVLIDTEGRSKKYSPKEGERADPAKGTYDFIRIDLDPPYRSDRCLEAIRMGLKLNPCALGFDCLSDEHDGEGGYLEWHDHIANAKKGEPDYVGGNEWAAWAKPAAARKRLSSALLHITTTLFFSFRAAEKTAQEKDDKGRNKIVNLGWMPVAPLLIVKALDLTCILPYDSKGVPVWESQHLPGEDFIRKWPDYLENVIKKGQLNEETGEALVRWAAGSTASPLTTSLDRAATFAEIKSLLATLPSQDAKKSAVANAFNCPWPKVEKLPDDALAAGLAKLRAALRSAPPPEPPQVPADGNHHERIAAYAQKVGLPVDQITAVIGGPLDDLPPDLETMAIAKIGEWSDEKGEA